MPTFPVDEAQRHLADLIARAAGGEEIVIRGDGRAAVRLVPVPIGGVPRFGSANGMFTVTDDFDAPLDDFTPEYTG